MEYKIKIVAHEQDRIDKFIASHSKLSRSDAQKLIKGNAVFVNDSLVRKTGFTVRPGSVVKITEVIKKEISAKAEKIPINIIYEDNSIAIINKKTGMVVHPAPGHPSGTLVNALLFHFKGLSDINGEIRPGIVHRIDKDTSGLLVVAKNNDAHVKLAHELKEHNIKRSYLAWVEGKIENDITHINLPIGRDIKDRKKMSVTEYNSKEATTHVYVEKILNNKTLIRCELETGRTHQIRVHLAHIKHPIVGDPVYGTSKSSFGQHLHAYKLELIHPITKKPMSFTAPIPDGFDDMTI